MGSAIDPLDRSIENCSKSYPPLIHHLSTTYPPLVNFRISSHNSYIGVFSFELSPKNRFTYYYYIRYIYIFKNNNKTGWYHKIFFSKNTHGILVARVVNL